MRTCPLTLLLPHRLTLQAGVLAVLVVISSTAMNDAASQGNYLPLVGGLSLISIPFWGMDPQERRVLLSRGMSAAMHTNLQRHLVAMLLACAAGHLCRYADFGASSSYCFIFVTGMLTRILLTHPLNDVDHAANDRVLGHTSP